MDYKKPIKHIIIFTLILFFSVSSSSAQSILNEGTMIVGAFSKEGPKKCSGLPIQQYDVNSLKKLFSVEFEDEENMNTIHMTPSNVKQNYVFCRFKRKIIN